MLGLLAAAALASEGTPQVLARLRGRQFARMGIVAELVKRPAGISDEAFAQRLIDAEGLRPWNGKQFEMPARKGGMAAKAVFQLMAASCMSITLKVRDAYAGSVSHMAA